MVKKKKRMLKKSKISFIVASELNQVQNEWALYFKAWLTIALALNQGIQVPTFIYYLR